MQVKHYPEDVVEGCRIIVALLKVEEKIGDATLEEIPKIIAVVGTVMEDIRSKLRLKTVRRISTAASVVSPENWEPMLGIVDDLMSEPAFQKAVRQIAETGQLVV